MDGSAIEHSDSDSGDSWTLLDNSSNYVDDAPDVPDHPLASNTPENHDKDDDTDGISIISDSEPESPSPCQINYEHYLSEENTTNEHPLPQFIPINSNFSDNSHDSENNMDDDFLGDSNGKHKTYVHKRNKRLSTVLNIIMLGSVITAAGVAIGHMWGAKTDCSMHTPSNVNKILSNLYKLQEENAYLRGKLKELTVFNIQANLKPATKYNKCKKTFEEPLANDVKVNDKFTKCVDDRKLLESHMAEAVNQGNRKWVLDQKESFSGMQQKHDPKNFDEEKRKNINDEYLNETKDLRFDRKSYADSLKYIKKVKESNEGLPEVDTDKLYIKDRKKINNLKMKDVYYKRNNLRGDIGFLDELFNESKNSKRDSDKIKADFGIDNKIYDEIQIMKKNDNNRTVKVKVDAKINEKLNKEDHLVYKNVRKEIKKMYKDFAKEINDFDINKNLKDLYHIYEKVANNVKTGKAKGENHTQTESNKKFRTEGDDNIENTQKSKLDNNEEYAHSKGKKLKQKREIDSEEDIRKDDRYTGQKKKQERKKHDRQQTHKKAKRKNKYEQWEMKGGLLRDYELSEVSSEEFENNLNEPVLTERKNNNFKDNKIGKNIGTDDNQNYKNTGHSVDMVNTKGDTYKEENDWQDQRALLRKEARQRLQQEMFGKSVSNAANWYFRRMRKREKSREKGDNSTYKRFLKRDMNYKSQH